jgi:hypothetical protein
VTRTAFDPAPPNPLSEEQWRRFPLAKRRLITDGPTDGGSLAVFETFLIAAVASRTTAARSYDRDCRQTRLARAASRPTQNVNEPSEPVKNGTTTKRQSRTQFRQL